MFDFDTHAAILRLIIGYTLVGAFVFTVIITCLSLVGLVEFANPKQQQALFGALILELVVIVVANFSDWIVLQPERAVAAVTAPLEEARAEALAERNAAVATLEQVFERVETFDTRIVPAGAAADTQALDAFITELKALRTAEVEAMLEGDTSGEIRQ